MAKTYVFRESGVSIKGEGDKLKPVKKGVRTERGTGIESPVYFPEVSDPYRDHKNVSFGKYKIAEANERDMPRSQGGYQMQVKIDKDGARPVVTIYGKESVAKFKKLMGVTRDGQLRGKQIGANIAFKGHHGGNAYDISNLEITASENEEEEVEEKTPKKAGKKKAA